MLFSFRADIMPGALFQPPAHLWIHRTVTALRNPSPPSFEQGAKKLQRVTELPQSAEDSQGAKEPKYCCNRLCHHKPPSEKQMFEPAPNLYFFALLMAVPPAWEAWLFVFFSRF